MRLKQAPFVVFLFAVLIVPSTVFTARIPNDPLVRQWGFEDVHAFDAWEQATGSNDVIVAVIDNGFDTFHPDLRDNIWINEGETPGNGIDDDGNGFIDDVYGWNFSPIDLDNDGFLSSYELIGNNNPRPPSDDLDDLDRAVGIVHHGTVIAGIIGAVGNNGLLGAGLNWDVRLMNLKVVENTGTGPFHPLPRAVRYAVDNGADVINISLVSSGYRQEVIDAIKYAYDHNVVVVAAVGNGSLSLNESPMYPACSDAGYDFQMVLGVSAIEDGHFIASFSNVGSDCVDITAPGVDISGPLRYDPQAGLNSLYDSGFQGTSFSAPFVAGTAALVRSIQPNWTADQVYEAILSSVHRTPPEDPIVYEHLYGAGLLRVDKAVQFAIDRIEDEPTPEPIPSPEPQSTLPKSNGEGTILSVQRSSGLVNFLDIATGEERKSFSAILKAADGVDIYEENGEQRFVVSRIVREGIVQVAIFTERWAKLDSWEVALNGPHDVRVVDVHPHAGVEIILVPRESAKYGFKVYSFAGSELHSFDQPQNHNGASLAIVPNDTGVRPELVVTFTNFEGNLQLHHLSSDYLVKKIIELPFLLRKASVGVGDIDGDGEMEFVVGASFGQIPYLAFFEQDGTEKRRFFAYDTSFQGGISLAIIDYDGDGADDVLITHKTGGQPVRVWNHRSKNLFDFFPFGERNLHDIILRTF